MPGTFKVITIVGTSSKSHAEAITNAVTEAAKTVRNLAWFEVKELRGAMRDGKITEYQAAVAIGFKVER